MAIKKSKKKVAVAVIQFTAGGVLYKKGDAFIGSKKQTDALIIKNIIKWEY